MVNLKPVNLDPRYTWMNGELVPWNDSRIHVNTDAVLRGASVFEGIRAYRSVAGDELNLFRVMDHLRRMFKVSMRVLRMSLQYSPDDLARAVIELLRANEIHQDAHVRVVAYFDEPELSGGPDTTGAFILAFPRPQSAKLKIGMRSTVSAWRRLSDTSMSPRVKASGNYLNGRLAVMDAKLKGFDTPVLLNEVGKVSEGPGQNLFLVRDGTLITPRITDAILEGVTRQTVIGLAGELDVPVEEREVDPTELYVADELFFVGTLIEIQPITEIDFYTVGQGSIGPLTERLQRTYLAMVRGSHPCPPQWLTPVHSLAAATFTT